MNNTCKKCDSNLYGNKYKCPFCGEPIKSAPKAVSTKGNTYSYATKPNSGNYSPKKNTAQFNELTFIEMLILIALSFFIPPLGIVFFFSYNKKANGFALLSLAIGIVGILRYIN